MTVKTLADALRPFTFRGKARLLHSLCPKGGERDGSVLGYRIGLDLRDYIQRSIYLGVFEPYESAQVRRYLKPGMTFVDVGANVGYYTLMAAALVGRAGRVFAFEPSPYAFQRLNAALVRNGLSNVRAMQVGLSDRAGEESLFMPDRPGNHTPSMVSNGGGRPINVTVRRLDECLAEHQVDRVDLLKIDVEGFEPNVIEGALEYIAGGRIGAVLCEFNSHWLMENGSGSEEFYRRLTDLGFKPAKARPNFESLIENVFFTYGK